MDCPFCTTDREITASNQHSYATPDGFPVSRGHTLIIPKRHVMTIFDLTFDEYHSCFNLVREVRDQLSRKLKTEDFNVGVNCGTTAGQTIDHAHIHLIPRYEGDVENPRGGVRHVIPGKGFY